MTTPSTRPAPLPPPPTSAPMPRRDIAGALNALLADTFALYLKTKNFHWHCQRPALPRLPPAARRAGRRRSSPRPTRSPSACASSAARRCARSATSRGCSASATTMPTTSTPQTCWPSCATTTARGGALREAHELCDEHDDVPPRACSRSGSTRPSDAPGSCSRPAAATGGVEGRRRTTCPRVVPGLSTRLVTSGLPNAVCAPAGRIVARREPPIARTVRQRAPRLGIGRLPPGSSPAKAGASSRPCATQTRRWS